MVLFPLIMTILMVPYTYSYTSHQPMTCSVIPSKVDPGTESRNKKSRDRADEKRPHDKVLRYCQCLHPFSGFPCLAVLGSRNCDPVLDCAPVPVIQSPEVSHVDKKHLNVSCPEQIPESAHARQMRTVDHVREDQDVQWI